MSLFTDILDRKSDVMASYQRPPFCRLVVPVVHITV